LASASEALADLGAVVGGLGDEQGASARGMHADLFEVGARAAAALGNVPEGFRFLESGRAGGLLEGLGGMQGVSDSVLPEGLRVEESRARTAEAAAADALRRAAEVGDLAVVRQRRAEWDRAREELRTAIGRIQREAKEAAGLAYPVAASLSDVQSALGPAEALLLYGLYEAESLAVVVTSKAARILTLPAAPSVEAAVDEAPLDDSAADPSTGLARLRTLVAEPLALEPDIRRVLVSPDGALAAYPLAPLFPGREVAAVPSGTLLRRLRAVPAHPGTGILAIGDPDHLTNADPHSVAAYVAPVRGGPLGRLPNARREAETVGDVVLVDREATVPRLRTSLAARDRWRGLHFACHGIVDPDHVVRCSLVLAPSGEDTGFLTALDVVRMRVPADLVALSACETGKGRVVRGEGVLGLARAFMFAGSPRVLSSLWKVPDDATEALMTRFYALWNPRDGTAPLGAAAALSAAQEHVRSQPKWRHPRHWAAWTLWGLPE
jgi:hypothetical protein